MLTTMFINLVLGFSGTFASLGTVGTKYEKCENYIWGFVLLNVISFIFAVSYKVIECINSDNFKFFQ